MTWGLAILIALDLCLIAALVYHCVVPLDRPPKDEWWKR